MKKIIMVGLVTLLLFACATAPKGITTEDKAAIDAVVNKWIKAIMAEDIEALVETYWSEIDYSSKWGDNAEEIIHGIEGVRDIQQKGFDGFDGFANLVWSELQRDFESEPGEPIYTILSKMDQDVEWGMENTFQLAKRNGEWRIISHIFRSLP